MTTNDRPKPPISCTPCRVTYQGVRYQIESNGEVREVSSYENILLCPGVWETWEHCRETKTPVGSSLAKLIRREAARQRRNRANREKYQAMKDLGMVKTPYGWE